MSNSGTRRGGIPLPACVVAVIFGCAALLFFGMATKAIGGQWGYWAQSTSVSGVAREAEYGRGLGADITVAFDGDGSGRIVSIEPRRAPQVFRKLFERAAA